MKGTIDTSFILLAAMGHELKMAGVGIGMDSGLEMIERVRAMNRPALGSGNRECGNE